jgi:hypothetical protein
MEEKNPILLTIMWWFFAIMIFISVSISAWTGMLDGPRFIIYSGFLFFFWWTTHPPKSEEEIINDEIDYN